MLNKYLRLTAGFLATALLISSVPAESIMAKDAAEVTEYITVEPLSFSAGANSAIAETVVVTTTEDDSILVDGETGVTENETPTVAVPEEQEPEVEDTVVETPENPYANMAIADGVSDYLNIRQEPTTDSKIVGKIYKNNAATVLEVAGDWLKIETGKAVGYVYAKYLTVGDEEVCKNAATIKAKITTNSLRLRKKATTDSGIATLLGKGQKVTVLDDSIDGWLKVKYKSYTGYISADYAEITVTYTYGETKAEYDARIAKEKEAQKQKEEAAKKEQANSNKTYNEPTGSDGQAVVDYAVQFVGNRYVWGGESLTKGVDCSGFVMKVYEKFGISLPHSSYKLRSVGKKVSASDLQPGDIICYKGHVAIYIGDGKIVHAANRKQGIIISNKWNYTKVITIRRVL